MGFQKVEPNQKNNPIALCTWNLNQANAAAGKALQRASMLWKQPLAAEAEEANPLNTTGYGGAPTEQVELGGCL